MEIISKILISNRKNISSFWHKHSSWLNAFIILCIASLIFLYPIFKNQENWGGRDWYFFQTLSGVARESILEYHQIPLWNPYQMGGIPLLANPQSTFLSPSFIFIILFGVILGQKLQVLAYLILGMFGIYMLSRYLDLGGYSSYLPPVVYMLSSIYALRIAVGHVTWMAMAWIPWVFLFFLKSFETRKNTFIIAIFLTLMVFEGGIYIFSYTVLLLIIYSIFKMIQVRNMKPLMIVSLAIILSLLISAVKFLPLIELSMTYPMLQSDSTGYTLEIMYTALLERTQGVTAHVMPNQGNAYWHEYGTYIGILPLFLSLIGIVVSLKSRWPLILTGAILLIISLGKFSPINMWSIIQLLPLYNSLKLPIRIILVVIFIISILGGIGLSRIEERYKKFAAVVIFIIFIDLLLINGPILYDTFTVSPPNINRSETFYQIKKTVEIDKMYQDVLENKGVIDSYEGIITLPQNAIPRYIHNTLNPNYRGEVFLLDNGDSFIYYLSPNIVKVSLNTSKDNTLILNQNFFKDWYVRNEKGNIHNTKSYKGLISIDVTPKDKEITFFYLPKTFVYGSIITMITIVIALLYIILSRTHNFNKFFRR